MDFEHLPHAELLAAYLDGEATPDERTLVERLLAEQPEYQQLAAELQALSGTLAALPKSRLGVDLSAAVLDEIASRQNAPPPAVAPIISAAPAVEPGLTAEGRSEAPASSADSPPHGRADDADWFERLPLATAPRTGGRLRWWTLGVVASAAALMLMIFAAEPFGSRSGVTRLDGNVYTAAPRTAASPAAPGEGASEADDKLNPLSESKSSNEVEAVRLQRSESAERKSSAERYQFEVPAGRDRGEDQPASPGDEMHERAATKENLGQKDAVGGKLPTSADKSGLNAPVAPPMEAGQNRPRSAVRSSSPPPRAAGSEPARVVAPSPAPAPPSPAAPAMENRGGRPAASAANAERPGQPPRPAPAAPPAAGPAGGPAAGRGQATLSDAETPSRAFRVGGAGAAADVKADRAGDRLDGRDYDVDEVLVVELEVTPQAVQSGQFNGQLNQWFVENRIAFAAPAPVAQFGRRLNAASRTIDRAAEEGADAATDQPAAAAPDQRTPVPGEKTSPGGNVKAESDNAPSSNGAVAGSPRSKGGDAETAFGVTVAPAAVDSLSLVPTQLGLYIEAEPAQIEALLGDVQAKHRGPVALGTARWAKSSNMAIVDGTKLAEREAAPGPASLSATWEGFRTYIDHWMMPTPAQRNEAVKAAPMDADGVAGAAPMKKTAPAPSADGADQDGLAKEPAGSGAALAPGLAGDPRSLDNLARQTAGAPGVASLVQVAPAHEGLTVYFAYLAPQAKQQAADEQSATDSRGAVMRYGESLRFVMPTDGVEAQQVGDPQVKWNDAAGAPLNATPRAPFSPESATEPMRERAKPAAPVPESAPAAEPAPAPAASAKPSAPSERTRAKRDDQPAPASSDAPAPAPPTAGGMGAPATPSPVTAPATRTGDQQNAGGPGGPKGGAGQTNETKLEDATAVMGDQDRDEPRFAGVPARRRVLFVLKLASPLPAAAAGTSIPVAGEAVPAGPVPAAPVPASPVPASPAAPQ